MSLHALCASLAICVKLLLNRKYTTNLLYWRTENWEEEVVLVP